MVLKLTPINELLGKPLSLGLKDEPILLVWMLGLSLVVGLLSGLYPAFYLSSISPLSALAGFQGKGLRGFRLRELLVLTQFAVAVIVISCTLIMAMQMRYVSQKPLGFEKHNRVIIQLRGMDLIEKYCRDDVRLTRDLYLFGVENGFLKYKRKDRRIAQVIVDCVEGKRDTENGKTIFVASP